MKDKPQLHTEVGPWGEIKSNWIIALVHKIVLFTTVASIAAIVLTWNKLPPLVPLWFSRPWGSDELASPIWLFILPLGSVLLYFINLLISVYLTAEYLIFTQVLFLTSFLVAVLSFVTLIKILFLIT